MPRTRHAFAEPVAPPRSRREDVDIVLDDEAARAAAETLEIPHTTPGQRYAAGSALCAIAGRDVDVTDPGQRRAAAEFARPALEALGLVAGPGVDDDNVLYTLCGTRAGYRRHYRRGEKPCQACRDAANEYERSRYTSKPRPRKPCGTTAAFKHHCKKGEKPCQACREAHSAYERERRKAKRQAR